MKVVIHITSDTEKVTTAMHVITVGRPANEFEQAYFDIVTSKLAEAVIQIKEDEDLGEVEPSGTLEEIEHPEEN